MAIEDLGRKLFSQKGNEYIFHTNIKIGKSSIKVANLTVNK